MAVIGRTPEDALRSVRRWMAGALGSPPWRGLLAADPGRTELPYFVVNDPDGWSQAPTAGAVGADELGMAVVVNAYPTAGERPSESKMIAERVATQMTNLVQYGMVDPWVPADGPQVRSLRQMVPLWSYLDDAGVPLPLAGKGSVSSVRRPTDWLRVDDGWSFRVRPEAADGDRFVVVGQLRVTWLRAAGEDQVRVDPVSGELVLVRDPTAPLLASVQVVAVPAPPDSSR